MFDRYTGRLQTVFANIFSHFWTLLNDQPNFIVQNVSKSHKYFFQTKNKHCYSAAHIPIYYAFKVESDRCNLNIKIVNTDTKTVRYRILLYNFVSMIITVCLFTMMLMRFVSGCDAQAVTEILCNRNNAQRQEIKKVFQATYGKVTVDAKCKHRIE